MVSDYLPRIIVKELSLPVLVLAKHVLSLLSKRHKTPNNVTLKIHTTLVHTLHHQFVFSLCIYTLSHDEGKCPLER